MENFMSQAHQRNQNHVVVDNPGKTIAKLREKQRHRNLIYGIVIGAMALTVALTGILLGTTTAHNHQLQAKISRLEAPTVVTQQVSDNDTTEVTPEAETTEPEAPRPARRAPRRWHDRRQMHPDYFSDQISEPVTLPLLAAYPSDNVYQYNIKNLC